MIERSKHYVVSNMASVAYRDSAVILKVAAGVDKHIFTYGDVLTEIRIEGWEKRAAIAELHIRTVWITVHALHPAYDKQYSGGT